MCQNIKYLNVMQLHFWNFKSVFKHWCDKSSHHNIIHTSFVLKLQSAAIWVFMFVWVHFAGAGLGALLLLEQT